MRWLGGALFLEGSLGAPKDAAGWRGAAARDSPARDIDAAPERLTNLMKNKGKRGGYRWGGRAPPNGSRISCGRQAHGATRGWTNDDARGRTNQRLLLFRMAPVSCMRRLGGANSYSKCNTVPQRER